MAPLAILIYIINFRLTMIVLIALPVQQIKDIRFSSRGFTVLVIYSSFRMQSHHFVQWKIHIDAFLPISVLINGQVDIKLGQIT